MRKAEIKLKLLQKLSQTEGQGELEVKNGHKLSTPNSARSSRPSSSSLQTYGSLILKSVDFSSSGQFSDDIYNQYGL